ncbi:MAG: DUF4136 domain-containing protein [Verrucomicrobiales bacterium]
MNPTKILQAGIALLSFGIMSCGTSVEMPHGHSKGYTSARLVQSDRKPNFADVDASTNRMIQNALADSFKSNGLTVGSPNADLIVGYLLIIQDSASTMMIDDYFGYGRDAEHIADVAHIRGVVNNESPERFERGAIVIDVMDAKTNKLVYRNFAKRDLHDNLSEAARKQRIQEAVNEAMAKFFE